MRPCLRTLAVALAALLAGAAHANLLVNGSFEDGVFVNQGNQTMSLAPGSSVISGWTVLTDATAWINATDAPNGKAAICGLSLLWTELG